jgi:excisionase family DNA binding protein
LSKEDTVSRTTTVAEPRPTTRVTAGGDSAARLWTVADVADYLGVPVKTLYRWRNTGYGPVGCRVGRYVRYRSSDVEAWIDEITNPERPR